MTFTGSFADFRQVEPPAQPSTPDVEPEQESEEEQEPIGVQTLVRALVPLAAFNNKLYLQAHLIHLNIEGPLFLPLHAFFKDQYEASVANFDATAEFVRTLDFLMPMCEKGLNSMCPQFKHVKDYDTRAMSSTYLKNVEQMGMYAKEVAEIARAAEAIDVENFCADLVAFAFKSAWQLKATLRGA